MGESTAYILETARIMMLDERKRRNENKANPCSCILAMVFAVIGIAALIVLLPILIGLLDLLVTYAR